MNDRNRARVLGLISFLIVLLAFPLGAVGAFLIWEGQSASSEGPASAVSAFLVVFGAGLSLLAVLAFVVGGVVFVRSARR